MKSRTIYFMKDMDEITLQGDLFIFNFDGEDRSYYGWNNVCDRGDSFKTLLVLIDNNTSLRKMDMIHQKQGVEMLTLEMPKDQIEYVQKLKDIENIVYSKYITIDISCFKMTNVFLLMKYLKVFKTDLTLTLINTIPYDYIFEQGAFDSYKSYFGDLMLREIIGFGGMKDVTPEEDLFVFLGFEGTLALKVVEETAYKELYFVNALPSYYQKYKDISLINNYNLLTSRNKNKILYAPATNPFEVYNMLDSLIHDNQPICIAPLCTKPIALGICMYALDHVNVRIVYPASDSYNDKISKLAYKTYVYKFDL